MSKLPLEIAKQRDELADKAFFTKEPSEKLKKTIWAHKAQWKNGFDACYALMQQQIENLKWDYACNTTEGVKHILESKERERIAIEALKQIKKRFDDEDTGGMPSPERGPGMAWAMMSDARVALAKLMEPK